MAADFFDAFQGTNTVVGIFCKEALNESLDLFRNTGRFGEFRLRIEDRKKDILFFGCIER
jgi:hypothetical protein